MAVQIVEKTCLLLDPTKSDQKNNNNNNSLTIIDTALAMAGIPTRPVKKKRKKINT